MKGPEQFSGRAHRLRLKILVWKECRVVVRNVAHAIVHPPVMRFYQFSNEIPSVEHSQSSCGTPF